MAKKLIYKNAYERYEIEDEIFDFYEAPFYKESEHNYKEKEADAMTEIFKERHDNVYFISATGNAKEIIENDELFDELVQTIRDSKDIPLDDYDLDEAYTIGFDDWLLRK